MPRRATALYEQVPEEHRSHVRFQVAPNIDRWGSHHTKMMLLFYQVPVEQVFLLTRALEWHARGDSHSKSYPPRLESEDSRSLVQPVDTCPTSWCTRGKCAVPLKRT